MDRLALKASQHSLILINSNSLIIPNFDFDDKISYNLLSTTIESRTISLISVSFTRSILPKIIRSINIRGGERDLSTLL